MKQVNKKGFTIVELVIVIAVIAILAAVMIPTFSNVIETAEKAAFQQKAAEAYKNAYALDMADGKQDEETFTYSNDKYAIEYNSGTWGDVEEVTEAEEAST